MTPTPGWRYREVSRLPAKSSEWTQPLGECPHDQHQRGAAQFGQEFLHITLDGFAPERFRVACPGVFAHNR